MIKMGLLPYGNSPLIRKEEISMTEKMKIVGKKFGMKGNFVSCEPLTNGNINVTAKVTYENNGVEQSYVFQRINQNVFKKPVEIMENIKLVTSHILNKGARALQFYNTDEGVNYWFDDEGGFWRVTDFIAEHLVQTIKL